MSLIFIVADSLRHDALGCFGGAARTPTVDSLARGSALFERVISAAPWTVPSVAAMLTGVYAHRLGLARWDQPWPAATPSLFSRAKRSGYRCASFVFDPAYLFSAVPQAAVHGSSQDTGALIAWLRQHRREPFVLFIHYWWTHIPYLDTPMDTATWRRGAEAILQAVASGPEARDGVKRLYRRAVERFSEVWLPRVLEAADLERTWLLLTADHGESWAERPGCSPPAGVFDLHGNSLYEEVLRIPLLLRPPGGGDERRISALTRSVDILPTLAELLSLQGALRRAGEMDGASVAGAVLGREPRPATDALSVMSRDFVDTPSLPRNPADLWSGFALTTSRHKLIWQPGSGREGERRQAFDLSRDPGEAQDISGQQLPALEQGWRRLEMEAARAKVGELAPGYLEQTTARLRELGYLDE